MSHGLLRLLCLFAAIPSGLSFAGDWPQFRGPASAAIAADAEIPAQPKIEWSVPLPGRGLSSPIVIGEKVFITCASGPKQERLHVLCLAAADGAKLWERQLQATGRTMTYEKSSVAANTPCSDGQRVFALWSSNDLAAFDLEGNLLWLRGLTADYPNASNSLGMASSPIVVGATLVVMIENDSESYSLGIDRETGRNLWKLTRPKAANWTSPLPWRPAGSPAPAVLLQSSAGVLAVDAASGQRLWEYTEGASTISSGVIAEGVLYAVSKGITALAPGGAETPTELWRSKPLGPSMTSPVVLGDRLFSVNAAGVLTAAEVKTGNLLWKLRLAGQFSSSPVAAGQRLTIVNEKGLVQIVETAGAEGILTGQLQLPLRADPEEYLQCTPALHGPHFFLRTDTTLWRVGP